MALDPRDVSLSGRVALVTGAAVGLGEAIAVGFARFGADLAICDRDAGGLAATASQVRAAGRRVFQSQLDVRDAQAVNRFVADALAELGRLDVLVNNAGGGFRAPFLEVREKGQRALVDENFTSVTNFVRAVAPHLPDGSGAIVNLTSIEAHRAGPGYAIYAAMKAAVANLSMSLAVELGARGIRVNCIAPDVIPTPGIGEFEAETPLARAGHPDDVAGAALFLASSLSGFVTGTTLHVDGGNRAAGGWRRDARGRFHV
jgi:NAD(P)-dependent dehydrogenase (short-subunit alcohol dehydrogenase family)